MGDDAPQAQRETTAQMLQAFQNNLPGLIEAVSSNVLPLERARAATAEEVSPRLAELQRQLAPINVDIERIGRRGAAETDVGILEDTGPQAVRQARDLAEIADPEFFQTREQATGRLGDLLGSIDVSGELPGSVRAEIERSINRENLARGTSTAPSQTQTVSNALQFGQAGENRLLQQQQALGQALGVAGGVAPAFRSGFDPVQIALGRPSQSLGQAQFAGVQQPSGGAEALGGQLLGEIGQTGRQEQQIESQRRDLLDRLNETTASIGSIVDI